MTPISFVALGNEVPSDAVDLGSNSVVGENIPRRQSKVEIVLAASAAGVDDLDVNTLAIVLGTDHATTVRVEVWIGIAIKKCMTDGHDVLAVVAGVAACTYHS